MQSRLNEHVLVLTVFYNYQIAFLSPEIKNNKHANT